jgi:valyl-tRNA synthetase
MLQPVPTPAEFPRDEAAEREIAWLKSFILGIRQIRSGMDIAPSKKLPVLLQNASPSELATVERNRAMLERLAGAESITALEPGTVAPQSATALIGELTLLVPMAGLIDAAAEIERLGKRIAKAREDLGKTNAKLNNENFVRNAPPQVVATERERAAELERTIASLEEQLARIRKLGGS